MTWRQFRLVNALQAQRRIFLKEQGLKPPTSPNPATTLSLSPVDDDTTRLGQPHSSRSTKKDRERERPAAHRHLDTSLDDPAPPVTSLAQLSPAIHNATSKQDSAETRRLRHAAASYKREPAIRTEVLDDSLSRNRDETVSLPARGRMEEKAAKLNPKRILKDLDEVLSVFSALNDQKGPSNADDRSPFGKNALLQSSSQRSSPRVARIASKKDIQLRSHSTVAVADKSPDSRGNAVTQP